MRFFVYAGLTSLLSVATFAQTTEPAPKFDFADVHVSAKSTFPFPRTGPVRNGRYEIKTATMADLVAIAWGFSADKVLGGPSWLESDRFDVIAKVPPDTTPEMQKRMLQSLLEDRFKLVVHKDTHPLPAFALVAGKKPQLKPADGAGDAGCKLQTGAAGPPGEGGVRLNTMLNGVASTINLGPGGTLQYQCRNMTMESFVQNLRTMMGVFQSLGANPVLDQTGLEGRWNFDVRYSMPFMLGPMANASDRITIFDAIDKQLGLKLEPRQVPTPVIVVDSVNRKPADNPPGTAEALPPIPPPTEFEVADVKPSDSGIRMNNFQMQPGGRLNVRGMPMRFLVNRAFNTNNNDAVAGLPKWADEARFDITAKAPSDGSASFILDMDLIAPLLRSLLADRFKMTWHSDERTVPAYVLVAAKPKMKKADPNSRTFCKTPTGPAAPPPGTTMLNCQNVTMAEFAERLQNMSPELSWPVADATGLEGGWDFTLTFTRSFMNVMAMGPGRGGEGGGMPAGVGNAPDPTGGITIFEAIEKQLGLKLESQKRSLPVIVIDHIEEKPTDN